MCMLGMCEKRFDFTPLHHTHIFLYFFLQFKSAKQLLVQCTHINIYLYTYIDSHIAAEPKSMLIRNFHLLLLSTSAVANVSQVRQQPYSLIFMSVCISESDLIYIYFADLKFSRKNACIFYFVFFTMYLPNPSFQLISLVLPWQPINKRILRRYNANNLLTNALLWH